MTFKAFALDRKVHGVKIANSVFYKRQAKKNPQREDMGF